MILPDVTIRPAAEADRDILYHWRSDPASLQTAGSGMFSYEEHCTWYGQHLQSATSHMFIIEQHAEPAGYIRYDETSPNIYTVSICIMPPYQGKHIGSDALTLTIAQFASPTILHASVRKDNPRSLAFFRKHGFTVDNTWPDPLLMRMQKQL